METLVGTDIGIEVKTAVSIRRKPGLVGLPGDDPINYNYKIGSAIKGVDALRGLTRQEEVLYLPHLINVYPEDTQHWLQATRDYWSNIAVFIPADEETSDNKLKGKVLQFVVTFKSNTIAEQYKGASLEDKVAIIQKSGVVVEGIADYVLFRYCLVYGRVANSFEQIYASPRIRFYLYSRDQEMKIEQTIFQERTKATRVFLDILTDEKTVDAVLRMFGNNPEVFENLGEKHLKVEQIKNGTPRLFMDYVNDKDLRLKANIKRAVELGIIYSPTNTDSYYYGADNDILLGNSLLDAVLFFKSEDEKKKQIKDSIVNQLKGK
jgi:hypothetical protein